MIQQYNLYTGEKIIEKKTKGTSLERCDKMISPNQCVIKKDDRFETAGEFYPDNFFLMSKSGDIYRTDAAFEPIEIIPSKDWWNLYQRVGDMQFIRGDYESLLIRNNKQVASLETATAFVMGDKIVDVTQHDLKTIKTSSLLQ